MSRSAFAARFHKVLGCAPIEYLARWRIALAKDALLSGAKSLDRIADEIGLRIRQRLQHSVLAKGSAALRAGFAKGYVARCQS